MNIGKSVYLERDPCCLFGERPLLALQVPGPGPQTGLGVGGPVVGTTTTPGPSPVRGSGSKPEKPLPHEENDGLFAPSLSQSLLTIISRKTNPEL